MAGETETRAVEVGRVDHPPVFELYVKQLTQIGGWQPSITGTEVGTRRATITAEHWTGARIVIGARYTPPTPPAVVYKWPMRKRRFYAWLPGLDWWKLKSIAALMEFAADPRHSTLIALRAELRGERPPYVRRPAKLRVCQCEKYLFDSKAEAAMAAVNIRLKKWRHGATPQLRAYRCPEEPKRWHITSKPLRGAVRP